MFSRYALHSDLTQIKDLFSVVTEQSEYTQARYNVVQNTSIPIIIAGKARDITLVDSDWTGVAGAPPSARLSDLQKTHTQAYKLLARSRCIIPMNGFYEWKVLSESLQLPFYFRLLQQEMFGVAGLYTSFEDESGNRKTTCTALQVISNELMEPLTESMPAILDMEDVYDWLNPMQADLTAAEKLIKPCKTNKMASYRVGNEINSTEADGVALIQPVV
ncbi:MAG: SOS response-associated peptidase family protein [Bacteroidetes bacterium]|nr:SOS response-associated peptidase family protein [Bacteroidota bacterium]MCH8524757.1 SOS response-associated peptidase [Balneolales bacterium]